MSPNTVHKLYGTINVLCYLTVSVGYVSLVLQFCLIISTHLLEKEASNFREIKSTYFLRTAGKI